MAPVLQGGHDRLARAARLRGQKLRRRRLRQVLVHTRGRRLSRRASTRHTRGPGRRLGRPSPAVFNLMVILSEFRSAAIIASCDGWSNRRLMRARRQCTNTARPIKKKISVEMPPRRRERRGRVVYRRPNAPLSGAMESPKWTSAGGPSGPLSLSRGFGGIRRARSPGRGRPCRAGGGGAPGPSTRRPRC